MTDQIFIPRYWPFWTDPTLLRRFDYKAVDGSMPNFTSVFSYDDTMKCMKLYDYDSHLTMNDIWFYEYRKGTGVVEFRDDYPEKHKKVVMDGLLGRPIPWGDTQVVGQSLIGYPKMNPVQSWPPAFSGGCQIVVFEDLLPNLTLTNGQTYSDVLVYSYLQSWDGHPATGARYWAAAGIGPVRLQWVAQDPSNPTGKPLIQTALMDATVTDVGGSGLVS
jgi:hypothetical protein